MPRFHKTLLVPGNLISDAGELLARETCLETDPPVLAGPFRAEFEDGHIVVIHVERNNPPVLVAELLHGEEIVDSIRPDGQVDQDYALTDGNTDYEVTVVRAARTVLTADSIRAYNAEGHNKCPACDSPEIHINRPQIEENGSVVCRVECTSCEARWKNVYPFAGISTDPEDWDPPQVNVAQVPA